MSAPLRILHVTRDYPPRSRGGLSTAVGGMVRSQQEAGALCQVLSFDDYRPKAKGGAEHTELALNRDANGTAIARIRSAADLGQAHKLGAAFAPDIVHLHHEMLWEFSRALAQSAKAKTVVSAHTLQSEQNRLRGVASTLSSESQGRAFAECHWIHAPSQTVADMICREASSRVGRVAVVPLGVARRPAGQAPVTAIAPAQPFLLYVGRFADINGFAELLEGIRELFLIDPTLHAVIAGGLPGNARAERKWRQRWQSMSGSDGDRLHFVGWQARDALWDLYARAAVLVVPSWFETFGQVAAEGMLEGSPLVSTSAGALVELVDDDTAVVIEARCAKAIVAGVQRVCSDDVGSRERAARARERMEPRARWERCTEAMLELYRRAGMNSL